MAARSRGPCGRWGAKLQRNALGKGICWGPVLWNIFFEDSNAAIEDAGLTEVKFADDLNAFWGFGLGVTDETIHDAMNDCQKKLHRWGAANQVAFDAG